MSIDPSLEEFYGMDKPQEGFDQVSIRVASPDSIREWSRGEVINPKTIDYRTFRPEKGGLFCERIFGPTKDWQCACGKYKSIKYKGVTCDRCGVEITLCRVRRERMGHIELAVPVTHIWFYKCMPSRLGLMMDMTARSLERVIYYEDYIVIDPGSSPLKVGDLLTETELREAEDEYGETFRADMGAEAIKEILSQIDLAKTVAEIEEDMEKTRSKQTRKKLAKRLKLARGFAESHSRPEWMVLEVLPVIPPDLRPLVPLEGGRFATSDLNDLYRRVINRNNMLKNLLMLKTPDVIIRNNKRMLQEAVDDLFDNGCNGRAVTGAGNRPLKSLSEMLKGKGGRFRQNLLGKRVDYSGRSVIVVGPELKLHQCGLPKMMALVLFEPFIIRRLKELGYVHTVRSGKIMIESKTPEVWDILEEVTKGHPVLLNRAPTLHRLSIQAFEPVLIEGSAIRLHPLVCSAYNADFDGDQMAVHVPLSVEAQMEARLLMLAPTNLFSSSNGKPITLPSQDIILGIYYLTHRKNDRPKNEKGGQQHLPIFADTTEVEFAIDSSKVGYHDPIRFLNPDFGKDTVFGDKEIKIIETTPGRVRFNEIWSEGCYHVFDKAGVPQRIITESRFDESALAKSEKSEYRKLGFINYTVSKKQISDIIWRCYQVSGQEETVAALDRLKMLGFKEATRSGASIGIVDMVIPPEKEVQLKEAYAAIAIVESQRKKGIITEGERYNKIIDIWTNAGDSIERALYSTLEYNEGKKETNPLFMMVDSGARGNMQQVKQVSGMRGLMVKPSGEIIERPITSNFREGLSVLEYFISTHGARKGLADTALKTADSGYMTRKLVDVAQDVIVTIKDCGTVNGITVESIYEGDEEVVDLATRIYGRTSGETIMDPVSGEIIVKAGDVIDEKQANHVMDIGLVGLKIRSVFSCEADSGCCVQCYGLDLASGTRVKVGQAVGIIAAQSIGEPGTQLTMRTYQTGGVALTRFRQPTVKAKADGFVRYNDLRTIQDKHGNFIALNKNGSVSLIDDDGHGIQNCNVVIGSVIQVADNAEVSKGATLLTWDPYNVPIISEMGGKIEFRDMIMGITIQEDECASAGDSKGLVVIDHNDDLHPQLVISDPKSGEVLASYSIPTGANLSVKDGQKITQGTQVAKIPRKVSKTKDITGGLPRIAELFEARLPKDPCVIAKIDGIVDIDETIRGKKKVIIRDPETLEEADHLIPMNKHITVQQGDMVRRGSQLTEGATILHDILDILGPMELQAHLVAAVQEVYRLQTVEINDKHIEIIIRQMLRKVKITDPGDSDFLWGDQIERTTFERANREIIEEAGKPAEAEPVLLGITKASLETESFISAASFQDTTRVLTDAATLGKVDTLEGFKENVIMGHMIPAGTGFRALRGIEVTETEVAEELAELAEEAASGYIEMDAELQKRTLEWARKTAAKRLDTLGKSSSDSKTERLIIDKVSDDLNKLKQLDNYFSNDPLAQQISLKRGAMETSFAGHDSKAENISESASELTLRNKSQAVDSDEKAVKKITNPISVNNELKRKADHGESELVQGSRSEDVAGQNKDKEAEDMVDRGAQARLLEAQMELEKVRAEAELARAQADIAKANADAERARAEIATAEAGKARAEIAQVEIERTKREALEAQVRDAAEKIDAGALDDEGVIGAGEDRREQFISRPTPKRRGLFGRLKNWLKG